MSRDNGKTWKNVTPKDLVGARIQTIEDSPHTKGRAYIAGYRFMREHDLKPYIYRTDDYGETWTLLTDGTNGIPADHPTRVVREDPRQAGLLYAGTEFGFFVSFNAGRNWQSLQQNLPATPVTDIRVHRNDLVISTMGRSRLDHGQHHAAAAAWRPSRRAAPPPRAATTAARPRGRRRVASAALPAVTLFQPREAMRLRNAAAAALARRAGVSRRHGAVRPVLRERAPGRHEARSARRPRRGPAHVDGARPARAPARPAQEMRGPFFRGGGSSAGIRPEAGMQRIIVGSPLSRARGQPTPPTGGPGGPIVPPGKYTVRLTAGGQTVTRTFDVKSDPRVATDGVSDAAIAEQVKFQLQVRDAISDARKLQQQIEQAMQKAGVKPVPRPAARPVARPRDVRPPAAGTLGPRGRPRPASTRRACWSTS